MIEKWEWDFCVVALVPFFALPPRCRSQKLWLIHHVRNDKWAFRAENACPECQLTYELAFAAFFSAVSSVWLRVQIVSSAALVIRYVSSLSALSGEEKATDNKPSVRTEAFSSVSFISGLLKNEMRSRFRDGDANKTSFHTHQFHRSRAGPIISIYRFCVFYATIKSYQAPKEINFFFVFFFFFLVNFVFLTFWLWGHGKTLKAKKDRRVRRTRAELGLIWINLIMIVELVIKAWSFLCQREGEEDLWDRFLFSCEIEQLFARHRRSSFLWMIKTRATDGWSRASEAY